MGTFFTAARDEQCETSTVIFLREYAILGPHSTTQLLLTPLACFEFPSSHAISLRKVVNIWVGEPFNGFQGREKDHIILSCVRANAKSGIGFFHDA